MFKLGLVGCGYWGKNLIREFYNLGVLDTICDIDIKLLKSYQEIYPKLKITNNYDDILNDSIITAVCVSLPAEMHYKFAKRALEHNKDLYVEKQITLNINEAQELVDIAKKNNKIIMVGHILQYHSAIAKIKEYIKDGKLGKIRYITSNRLNLGKLRREENVLWSFAPHDISVILSLCNNNLPKSVQCTGKSFVTPKVHDITNSILFYDDIYVNINVNWLNPHKEQKMIIVGDKGMLIFDDTHPKNKLVYFDTFIDESLNINRKDGFNIELDLSKSPLELECMHFINCCESREVPITCGEEGIRVLKVLTKLTESLLHNGESININNNFYAHPTATIDDIDNIGNGTKIWHYSHVSKNAYIGENCNIGQNVFIAPNTKLGNGCKIQNNVSIYSGVTCEDFVFLGPSCVLTNDINPRAEHPKNGQYLETYIEKGATIGANATIVCGNRIGKCALVGAGAVVTKNVEPYKIVVGNPAKVIGEIDDFGNRKIY